VFHQESHKSLVTLVVVRSALFFSRMLHNCSLPPPDNLDRKFLK
jgi:hypothetical protein